MAQYSTPSACFNDTDIAIVGAGIIGVACALSLRRRGLRVLVMDRQEPGKGASYGNAGHMATEQIFPVADAMILKRLPGMLMNPMGPLRLDWKYLPQALPWFTRLLLNLRPEPYRASVAGIRALNEASIAAWRRLLSSIGGSHLLKDDGSMLVFEQSESAAAIDVLQRRMAEHGIPVERWQRESVAAAAPQLSSHILGGLFFPATGHVVDPYRVIDALVVAAKKEGVIFSQEEVISGRITDAGVSLKTEKRQVDADRVLIACGAHSASLTAELTGKHVPLDTERGYHLMLPREIGRLPFAVTSLERRFIMTPMETGLRLGGTVEFAGLVRPPNMQRAWQLHRLSQGLFDTDLDIEEATPWMGFRPSLPDSLPIIDRVADGRVMLAFGHHHLGLTQAAITAELITRLACAESSSVTQEGPSLRPYQLERFGQGRCRTRVGKSIRDR
ncbi:NAD(P)/FAD-dependent oxidoreductase [Carnimonas nigrificans]|uniref:NAD(P)/FAD-dependent oxidoreductase n=1 Tax=Carnimonas nigrificans TaxID=64323 RepID=UPI0004726CC7|nr:FAD-dependent oxidoreductase [Carnimonas nigrificans]